MNESGDDKNRKSMIAEAQYERAMRTPRKTAMEIGRNFPSLRWVSVKDRLPERLKEIIIYRHSPHDKGSYDISVAVLDQHGRWSVELGRCDNFVVSHWMPLPEPPKE